MEYQRLLSHLENRHYRKKNGLTMAEGLRCCREALTRCPQMVQALLVTVEFAQSAHVEELWQGVASEVRSRLSLIEIDRKGFSKLAETDSPQGILAVLETGKFEVKKRENSRRFTLILDRVADPGNMGTILRTAWAIGLGEVWLVQGSADPWSPKCIRAGMGAQFAVATRLFTTLEEAVDLARKEGCQRVWCTLPGRGISIFDPAFVLRGNALIIGNEANGISRPELGEAVTIPMPGHAESLNAAQAATVFLIESLR